MLTEARSVAKNVDVERDVQSDSGFRNDPDSSETESQGAYLSECWEVLLLLSRGEGAVLYKN